MPIFSKSLNSYLIQRSAIEAYQHCPRKRYLNYELDNRGIQSNKLNIHFVVGGMMHLGIEYLLKYCQSTLLNSYESINIIESRKIVDNAIKEVLTEYDLICQPKEFNLKENEDQSFVYLELRALIESLIRVYAKVQLPRLLRDYDILEVEKEHLCKLSDNLTLMARPDAVLRHRASGDIFILSLKTANSMIDVIEQERKSDGLSRLQVDNQGISELIAVEDAYNKKGITHENCNYSALGNSICDKCGQFVQGIKVAGIKYEILIKGSRLSLNINGQKVKTQDSFLLHPWRRDIGLGQVEYSYRGSWYDEDEKFRKLGKGWNRINIWEDNGDNPIKDWIDILAEDEDMPLEKVVGTPIEYMRTEADVEEWKTSIICQEERIIKDVECLNIIEKANHIKAFEFSLNSAFPKYRHSCWLFNNYCHYINICWRKGSVNDEDYEPRFINHLAERFEFEV